MDPNYSQIFELLSKRLALMRQLAEALEQGQEPLVTLDLRSIQKSNMQQESLCRELSAIAEPLKAEGCRFETLRGRVQEKAAVGCAGVLSALKKRHPDLLAELAEMERRVRHLNRVYAALLRKTRQSFAVMNNLRSAGAITYGDPQHGATVEKACAGSE